MANKYNHSADVKVGKVKSKSRIYPQRRLPSQYIELAGKKAGIYETNEHQGDRALIIRFDIGNNVAAFHRQAERARASFACDVPYRGSDSGSNPDSDASFLIWDN
jgi:hypothetical protein